MIDESQYDKNWSLAGKIIYDKSNTIFMIFTGYSALNLEYNADAARRLNKIEILPLTYSHHLKLKYGINLNNNYEILFDLLFNGNIDESQKLEFETRNKLINTLEYTTVEGDKYIFYGGYSVYFNEKDNKVIRDKIVEMTKKVVNTDMLNIKNISEQNQTYSNRIIRYLASVESADISKNKISKYLNTSSANVENILNILEKTGLLFHLEAYGTSSKRTRKSWKYYFATSSLKYALSSKIGNVSTNKEKYEGILIENIIASKLHHLSMDNFRFSLYYNANKKNNVDFIIHRSFEKPIPIEVGRGKKDRKQ